MSHLFEITGDDIAQLGDADLRELIGLLCESDYRLAGLSTGGIKWGGHQDARDGGLDVVVRDEVLPPENSFVPRKATGFQVKKPDMPKAEILREMRPNGVLRDEIKNLIHEKGAYIIVSSSGSTTNTSLQNRTIAMNKAVQGEDDCQNIHLDFFDRGRVATWVRNHPSLILWVRNRIGRPFMGWRPYENWAKAPGGTTEEYLLDNELRFYDGTKSKDKQMSISDGVHRLRTVLSTAGSSARLAGLSGVGKTRLVQALFDERVGAQPLNQSLAYYADMSNGPDPEPIVLAEQLVALKTRAVLIIDNCPPDLHRRLTAICSKSTVSVLTVEYDVREDVPDETSVFRLEPSSKDLIEKLVRSRFSHVSQVDARTIAEFSGGNARIAIALANTVQTGETLSGFRDEELFERLFRQRNDSDKSLLTSAEACSLVYSFEGADTTSEKSELKILASLIDKSVSELYRDVNTLKERELIQLRNVWRALLPHAIANRLAKRALESIPKDKVLRVLVYNSSERLWKSFSRRLSYLHDSGSAREIVEDWLAPEGLVGKANCNFSDLGMEIFKNIAPVSPEKTLETIERAANAEDGSQFTSRKNTDYYEFVGILRHLAYDPNLFIKSAELISRFALSEKPGENVNSTRDVLKSLFFIYLSGTHAPVEVRAKFIEDLAKSGDPDKQELALLLLDAALESWHFGSHGEFDFGAWPRDFGYRPKSRDEILHWYETFINICAQIALSDQPIAEKARKTLANNLRGLWTGAGVFDALEKSVMQIHDQCQWSDGWASVREIIKFDSKSLDKEALEKLYALEKHLRPNSLLERARAFALLEEHYSADLGGDPDGNEEMSSRLERTQKITRGIGAEVARDPAALRTLLPELVSTFTPRMNAFGAGLADGATDKQEIWNMLCDQLKKTALEKRNSSVLLGFLSACAQNDPEFYNLILDNTITDDVLGEWFPLLQTVSIIDKKGVERLHQALDNGKASIRQYQYLAWGRAHESISDNDLANLLRKMLLKEEGIETVIEILKMRFFESDKQTIKYSDNLITLGREVLLAYTFPDERRRNNNLDYDLALIARVCLDGGGSIEAAIQICRGLAKATSDYRIYAFEYPDLLNALAQIQPLVFLDAFIGDDAIKDYHRMRLFRQDFERNNNPLNNISDEELLSWCDKDPKNRYPLIASSIQPLFESGETKELAWKPIVFSLLAKAPDVVSVLEEIVDAIRPTGWSGSLADILEKRSILFQSLCQHNNPEVTAWAENKYLAFQKEIGQERESEEKERNRKPDETFE